MRLLLDEMYAPRLAEDLRARAHDVLAVLEVAELRSQPDREVLRWAAIQERVVVTENVRDFAKLSAVPHSGILFVGPRVYPRRGASPQRLFAALDRRLREHAIARHVVEWL